MFSPLTPDPNNHQDNQSAQPTLPSVLCRNTVEDELLRGGYKSGRDFATVRQTPDGLGEKVLIFGVPGKPELVHNIARLLLNRIPEICRVKLQLNRSHLPGARTDSHSAIALSNQPSSIADFASPLDLPAPEQEVHAPNLERFAALVKQTLNSHNLGADAFREVLPDLARGGVIVTRIPSEDRARAIQSLLLAQTCPPGYRLNVFERQAEGEFSDYWAVSVVNRADPPSLPIYYGSISLCPKISGFSKIEIGCHTEIFRAWNEPEKARTILERLIGLRSKLAAVGVVLPAISIEPNPECSPSQISIRPNGANISECFEAPEDSFLLALENILVQRQPMGSDELSQAALAARGVSRWLLGTASLAQIVVAHLLNPNEIERQEAGISEKDKLELFNANLKSSARYLSEMPLATFQGFVPQLINNLLNASCSGAGSWTLLAAKKLIGPPGIFDYQRLAPALEQCLQLLPAYGRRETASWPEFATLLADTLLAEFKERANAPNGIRRALAEIPQLHFLFDLVGETWRRNLPDQEELTKIAQAGFEHCLAGNYDCSVFASDCRFLFHDPYALARLGNEHLVHGLLAGSVPEIRLALQFGAGLTREVGSSTARLNDPELQIAALNFVVKSLRRGENSVLLLAISSACSLWTQSNADPLYRGCVAGLTLAAYEGPGHFQQAFTILQVLRALKRSHFCFDRQPKLEEFSAAIENLEERGDNHQAEFLAMLYKARELAFPGQQPRPRNGKLASSLAKHLFTLEQVLDDLGVKRERLHEALADTRPLSRRYWHMEAFKSLGKHATRFGPQEVKTNIELGYRILVAIDDDQSVDRYTLPGKHAQFVGLLMNPESAWTLPLGNGYSTSRAPLFENSLGQQTPERLNVLATLARHKVLEAQVGYWKEMQAGSSIREAYRQLALLHLNTGQLDAAEKIMILINRADPNFSSILQNANLLAALGFALLKPRGTDCKIPVTARAKGAETLINAGLTLFSHIQDIRNSSGPSFSFWQEDANCNSAIKFLDLGIQHGQYVQQKYSAKSISPFALADLATTNCLAEVARAILHDLQRPVSQPIEVEEVTLNALADLRINLDATITSLQGSDVVPADAKERAQKLFKKWRNGAIACLDSTRCFAYFSSAPRVAESVVAGSRELRLALEKNMGKSSNPDGRNSLRQQEADAIKAVSTLLLFCHQLDTTETVLDNYFGSIKSFEGSASAKLRAVLDELRSCSADLKSWKNGAAPS